MMIIIIIHYEGFVRFDVHPAITLNFDVLLNIRFCSRVQNAQSLRTNHYYILKKVNLKSFIILPLYTASYSTGDSDLCYSHSLVSLF